MSIQQHPVVSRDEWTAARKRHLAHEKELTYQARMGWQVRGGPGI